MKLVQLHITFHKKEVNYCPFELKIKVSNCFNLIGYKAVNYWKRLMYTRLNLHLLSKIEVLLAFYVIICHKRTQMNNNNDVLVPSTTNNNP